MWCTVKVLTLIFREIIALRFDESIFTSIDLFKGTNYNKKFPKIKVLLF